jgi:peptide/nickel transport system substrate-binding protein
MSHRVAHLLIVALLLVTLVACARPTATPVPAVEPPAKATSAPAATEQTAAEPPATDHPTDEPAPTNEPPVAQELVIGLGRNLYDGPKTWYQLHGSLGVWEPLLILDNDMEPRPVLATGWTPSEDGKVWTFTLREGVRFHDGTPFDADAVLLNIPALQEEYSATLPGLVDLEKVDAYTVRFVMIEPTPDLPNRIAFFSSAMISPASLGEEGRPTGPIGTGPFRFVEYITDDSIILERNEDYWGELPRLEQVTFKYIPDANTRLSALQSGQIDAIADVGALQPEQASMILGDPNLVLKEQGVATTHYLTFNSGAAPFDDVRLRQAVSMALDRQALVDSTLYGYGLPGVSVITPFATRWANLDVAPIHDPQTAADLAREALQGERVSAKMLVSSALTGRWPYENIAQIVQAALIPLGIDVEIETVEAGAWSQNLRDGAYHMTMMPYTLMTGEPDFFMREWVWSQGALNVARSYGYADAHADELTLEAVSEMDPQQRKAMYDELQEIVARDVPFTPLYHEITIYAMRSDVHDLELDIQFKPSIERAYRGD